MQRRIPMTVFKPNGREFYYVQWVDSETGKKKTRSTKETKRRDAERFAADLMASLTQDREGIVDTTWAELCDEYRADVFPGQSVKTRQKTETTMIAVGDILQPKSAGAISASEIRRFKKEIRNRDIAAWTVRGYLCELRKILNWATRNNLISSCPNIEIPSADDPDIHAPTDAEYALIASKVIDVVGADAAASWTQLIEGIWWSGLRLSEARELRWREDGFAKLWIDVDREHPTFTISASFDKKRRKRVFTVAPEFVEFLRAIPKEQRGNYVFNPRPWGDSDPLERPTEDRMCKTISAIGQAAGVVTAKRKKKSGMKLKHASAHDLRRSFCVRWAARVLPPVLMEMARHESMTTTQKFYMGRNAESSARQAWDAYRRRDTGTDRAAS